jgi:hypothetical protein
MVPVLTCHEFNDKKGDSTRTPPTKVEWQIHQNGRSWRAGGVPKEWELKPRSHLGVLKILEQTEADFITEGRVIGVSDSKRVFLVSNCLLPP